MPKNKGKGGKNRRRGKNENECVPHHLYLPTAIASRLLTISR